MEQNDLLSSVLNDPEKLQDIMQMASSFLGGEGSDASAPSFSQSDYDPAAEMMQKAMPVLSEIAHSGQSAVSPEKRNLLNAMKPFVSSEISSQIDRGLWLVSLAYMATTALHSLGLSVSPHREEDEHV